MSGGAGCSLDHPAAGALPIDHQAGDWSQSSTGTIDDGITESFILGGVCAT